MATLLALPDRAPARRALNLVPGHAPGQGWRSRMRSGGGIPGLDPVHGTAGPGELRAGVRLPGSI